MIISPPFLPARAAGQTDDAWLDLAMAQPPSPVTGTGAPEGSFPLSHNLSWHNGMHLQAPLVGGVAAPVRAIADGTVIFASPPRTTNTNVDDAQNYNPFDRPGGKSAAWTDNGCVIIEHRSTIGAEGETETEVVFYSLTMHLSALGRITPAGQTSARILQAGDAIWRKDEIGTPGQIYGHTAQIHFEICLDAANLQTLIGRAPNWVEPAVAPAILPAPTQDGRTDVVFGSLYFYLPANTPTRAGATLPAEHVRGAAAASATTLGTPVWVKMNYHLGSCTFESYDERGVRTGALPAEADAEYNLYQEATSRHDALLAATRSSSSPSGWYELLRFGRNIGRGAATTDKDPLPANAAHWRRIPGPAGAATWADLNAPGTFKFSEADFLPVMGWNCVDDDTNPGDQRCDSDRLKTLIRDPDSANASRMEAEQLARRLGNADVHAKLRRVFCRFLSEWDQETTSTRYDFVKDLQPFKDAPEAWPRLEAHLKAISFNALPALYLAADWRGHPQELVGYLRKCGWLSGRELTQLLPRRHGPRAGQLTAITWPVAQARFANYVRDLNRTFRKYLIESAVRQSHFLAQTYIETAMWQTMEEFGRAHQQRRRDGTLYWPAPAMQYYQAFYGRGIMQLTWSGNYAEYGTFRDFAAVAAQHVYREPRITRTSLHYLSDPRDRQGKVVRAARLWHPKYDPSDIDRSTFNACDSGAHYWISKSIGNGRININRVCDLGMSQEAVGRASVLVNGGGYGFAERQAYAPFILRYRADSTESTSTLSFNVTYGARTHAVYVDFTPQRP